MTQDNQTTFDFFVPQDNDSSASQKIIEAHNKQFSLAQKSKWSPDKTLELLHASEARAHAVLHLRGMLSFQLKAAMGPSPSSKKAFILTLSAEVSMKTVTQDTCVLVRNAALQGRLSSSR